ncbi:MULTISPECIES: hypothetical protein [Aminobacterium]|jgi:hypothetical protein|uniref:hypothetical protein n=1 Tax=Aminobacterium TaxID=81466 RepID=UPI00257D3117|nr:hypothetical protein [Aminobacterium sp. UBA4987]
MLINLSPIRDDRTLEVSKVGDALTINGDTYDFSQLPEGATLPREAIGCEFILSDVNRINGEIELTILLPHGANASHEARFPEPLTVTNDGEVVLPE